MDLEDLMSIYARDIVSFDIVPPLWYVAAKTKVNILGGRPFDVPSSAEERPPQRLLASLDGVLTEDRWDLAHRARSRIGSCRSRVSGQGARVRAPEAFRSP
jgi:hypothetical protein